MKESPTVKTTFKKMGGKMKTLVIYNPASGLKKKNELQMIEGYLQSQKYDYDLFETTLEEGPFEILSKVDNDCDTIITCGGDGTVSQTLRGMHNFAFTCPLLILPLGTSNEIAQNLGLKDDSLLKVLHRLEDPEIINLDYGLISDDKTFTYALTFGNFTEVTYNTPQKMKNWLGYRAYILYGFLSFRKIKNYRVRFTYDQANVSGNYLFGSISNSATVGNVFHYEDDSMSLCDGLFEVLLISRPRSVKELRLILMGLIQNDYSSEMFTTFKAKKLTVSSKSDIDWNVDGEFAGSYKKLEVSNIHKGINLII